MTRSIAANLRERAQPETERPTTLAGALLALLREDTEQEEAARSSGIKPDDYYRTHIVEYFRDVLGVELTPPQQKAALKMQRAMHKRGRFAGKSGRRTGKSKLAAGGALWLYDIWHARVIITAPTARQVDEILWREITITRANARRPIAGRIGQLARTGLRDGTGREIVGFTAREAEAMQGLASNDKHPIVFIVDEASGVEQVIFDAIEGNRAGGGVLWMCGNPTRTMGEFFEAFHSKMLDTNDPESTGYDTCTLSTEEAATYGVSGLATLEYVKERAREWGEESSLYIVHVRGEFATKEEGRPFPLAVIAEAEQRWPDTKAEGRLVIGVDPAGAAGTGDESCFVMKRGMKVAEPIAMRGLDDDGHLVQILGLIEHHAEKRNGRIVETPLVIMDRTGSIGAALFGRLLARLGESDGRNGEPFELIGIRASERAIRQPEVYDTQRDELIASLEKSVREGLAIPADTKLEAEMHILRWEQHVKGRLKITPKSEIKKALGRSPDRLDALALACWEPLGAHVQPGTLGPAAQRIVDHEDDVSTANPSPWGHNPSPWGD